MENKNKILVSGCSFAGLTTAFWMNNMGYDVTIVEAGGELKKGGTPVDIKDNTIDIVKRMGLYSKIKANSVGPEKWEFKNSNDVSGHTMFLDQQAENEFEIERDLLLEMLLDLIKDEVKIKFSNSVISLTDNGDTVEVAFKDNTREKFSFVFGCDGVHSAVRRIAFGNESAYVHYLGQYFSIAVVNKLLVPKGSYQMYAEPDKGVALYAHNNKTDIIMTFRPEQELQYNFRDTAQQKEIIMQQFQGVGWRTRELLSELLQSDSFYFDKFCQVIMPSWTEGRIALVGDAAYCASPAAGMGGSLAIIGATALADAFRQHEGDYQAAFEKYNTGLRPFIEEVQVGAVKMLDKLLPRTQEEIDARNKNGVAF